MHSSPQRKKERKERKKEKTALDELLYLSNFIDT
jgi:hypothetical protein